jgi:hypothetical protein
MRDKSLQATLFNCYAPLLNMRCRGIVTGLGPQTAKPQALRMCSRLLSACLHACEPARGDVLYQTL